jgi:hypothetical protein
MMLTQTPTTSGERALTPTEYTKLLEVCQTQEEILMLHLAIGLGLRRTDLSQIRMSDVDLQNTKLSYYEHKKRRTRTVPLSPKLVQTLQIYLSSLGKGHRKKYLFAWGGTKYGDRTAHRHLQALCDRARIPRRPFHALRATCIKFCQRAGWSPEQTAKLVGDGTAKNSANVRISVSFGSSMYVAGLDPPLAPIDCSNRSPSIPRPLQYPSIADVSLAILDVRIWCPSFIIYQCNCREYTVWYLIFVV